MKKHQFILLFTIIGLLNMTGCTNLDENVLDEQLGEDLITDPSNIDDLINAPYAQLRRLIEWADFWGLQEFTSDEAAIPTRGGDWYDNGAWQKLHLQTWDPDHSRLINVWNALGTGVARANTAINYIEQFEQNETTKLYLNEARFLRALFMYHMADLYGQVPFREADEVDFKVTPMVMDRKTAIDFIIDEINAVIPNLKTRSEVTSERVNVGAAYALLAKIYLNYEVYTGETKWNEAIQACDQVINSEEYDVTDDYWTMFQWDVADHPEFILTVPMSDQVNMGSGSVWINFTIHYNQPFGNYTSGNIWNGACTTPTFLDTWDQENDIRFRDDRIRSTTGLNQGFLIGQQYSVTGDALTDRQGNPLVFVPEFDLTESNERAGARVVKFAPNPNTMYPNSYAPNDYPLFRISEIYLARAEAKLRNGDAPGALTDINYIRSRRSAAGKTLPLLTSVTLEDILNERGYELYWEGYRRQDLVRFGRFDDAWYEKPATDESKALFAIPTSALDTNDNLDQNPGYYD